MLFRSNDTATTEIYTLSLHDALPISGNAAIGFVAGNANNVLTNTVYISNVSVTAAQPSYVDYKGFVTLNTVGTFGPAWASNISSANTVTRAPTSWMKMTKVG